MKEEPNIIKLLYVLMALVVTACLVYMFSGGGA